MMPVMFNYLKVENKIHECFMGERVGGEEEVENIKSPLILLDKI